jgi:serine/threonine protein kinase
MGCLEFEVIRAWRGGFLSADDRDRADQHMSECPRCRERASALRTVRTPRPRATPPVDGHAVDEVAEATAPARKSAAPRSVAGEIVARTQPYSPAVAERDDAALADALAAGTQVGRFVIRRSLGAGGMGAVYAADDPELGRQVAVKLLHGGSGSGRDAATAARRIVREARLAAQVSHPNVVSIFEVGQFGGQVFIAMELVAGSSLSAWLAARPRSLEEILDVMVAAGSGLAAAHAAGLVHRDFKPDNVLVGDDGRARVTDFGVARRGENAIDPDPVSDPDPDPDPVSDPDPVPDAVRLFRRPARDLSRSGAGAGTPAYMAPEQHAGGHTDQRTDQFSFCVTLYEALYRQRPFAGDTAREIAAEVQGGRVQSPPGGSRVPTSLHRIVARGLSVRPGDRFASMGELLDALGRDRTRPLRVWAFASLVALVAVTTGLAADWIARGRTLAVTRSSFAAAHGQLGRSLALRYEAFVAMSDLSYVVPVIREVTGNLDQSDFGLGDEAEDRRRLAEVHENLRSADWMTWARASQRGVIGVADYKGRLVFTSAATELWGNDVRALDAVERALHASAGAAGGQAMVIRGDDPRMVAAGLLGGTARPGLHVVFARATILGGAPRAVFIQTIEGRRLLSDVSLGEGAQLALVAPGGAAEGDIPPPVLVAGRGARGTTEEVRAEARTWLVSSYPLRALGGEREIATIVLARPIDTGLAGLFPAARLVLGILALALLASTLTAALWARGARLRLTAARP